MKEAHSKMRNNGESDESFKKRFTAERSRQFDILQAKEAIFLNADGCSERASEFSMPGYQLKRSDGRKLNFSIKEHRAMVEKLNHGHIERCKGTRFHTLSVQLSRKSEIMFTPSCNLKSTLWRKALLLLAALVKETPIATQAATKNSTTAKMKMSASESWIRK